MNTLGLVLAIGLIIAEIVFWFIVIVSGSKLFKNRSGDKNE